MRDSLTIFVPHCSGLLTDALPHGDGLVAHGFISRLAERGHRLYVAAERVELSQSLHPNVTLFPINVEGAAGTGRIRYMLGVRTLFRQLKKEVSFDLVHQLNPVYTGVSVALWDCGIPVVLGPYVADWPHDPDGMTGARPRLRGLLRGMKGGIAQLQQHGATSILLTTEPAGERVINDEVRRLKSHLVPHGIDPGFFTMKPMELDATAAPGSTVILFFANVSERKGIFDLLTAFDQLAMRSPSVQLWIAGGGEQLREAEQWASRLKAAQRIRFLGRQTREQSVRLFHDADIYCLPSHGEPFGMTALEAMSCGLPLVVTDAGGLASLVDEKGGIKVPVKDIDALARALERLVHDAAGRRAMGRYNRVKVLAEFAWDKVIDRLEEVYRMSLQSGCSGMQKLELAAPFLKGLSKGGEQI